MKTAVVYNSQTGFTKRYAEWITEAVGADCFEFGTAKKKDFAEYDAIVFGGWAKAGKITEISWFKSKIDKWEDKTLVVFCTGANPPSNPEVQNFLDSNFSEIENSRINVFYCPSGLNYEEMSMASRLMMKAFRKMLEGKKDKSEADIEMLKAISASYDISDKKYIDPIVELLR